MATTNGIHVRVQKSKLNLPFITFLTKRGKTCNIKHHVLSITVSPIKNTCFNSTVVQLEAAASSKRSASLTYFNSTLVQLESDSHPYYTKAYPGAEKAADSMVLKKQIEEIIVQVKETFPTGQAVKIGNLEKPVLRFIEKRGITPISDEIFVTDL